MKDQINEIKGLMIHLTQHSVSNSTQPEAFVKLRKRAMLFNLKFFIFRGILHLNMGIQFDYHGHLTFAHIWPAL